MSDAEGGTFDRPLQKAQAIVVASIHDDHDVVLQLAHALMDDDDGPRVVSWLGYYSALLLRAVGEGEGTSAENVLAKFDRVIADRGDGLPPAT